MVVEKRGNQWCTIHCHGEKVGTPIACFPTESEADTQHRAIEASKHANKIEIDIGLLIKTEKRIWIKPTSKRKVHYRKVNGENKVGVLVINKGIKIINVKGTIKRIAHKRKIKISDKDKDKNLKLEKLISNYEDSIKNQNYESCGVFNDKKLIFSKDGTKNKIDLRNEKSKCKGLILTHNHPEGRSFSKKDIDWACEAKMKEIRIIIPNGTKYIMKLKNGENFNSIIQNKIEKIYATTNNIVYNQFGKLIENGEISAQIADDKHWDIVWDTIVKLIPELDYRSN